MNSSETDWTKKKKKKNESTVDILFSSHARLYLMENNEKDLPAPLNILYSSQEFTAKGFRIAQMNNVKILLILPSIFFQLLQRLS